MLSARTDDSTTPKQSELRMLLTAMTIVPTVIVLIRLWSRALLPVSPTSKISTKFWWDDLTIIMAVVLNITVCIIGIEMIKCGLGVHIQDVPAEDMAKWLKLSYASYFVFQPGTALSKTSALFFYARVFSTGNSRFKYALWVVHLLNAAWLISFLMSITFMCTPIRKAWETTVPGHCINNGSLWRGSAGSSLVIDIIILVMPLPMLWKLQLKTARKLQICAVFICGYLVVVVSVGRLVTMIEAGEQLQVDPTYALTTPTLWLGSEIGISTISVSIPSIYFLARHVHSAGFWSILPGRGRSKMNSAKYTNSSKRSQGSHGEEDDGLVMPMNDYPEMPRTKATAEFDGKNEGLESVGSSGIHVIYNVEVV